MNADTAEPMAANSALVEEYLRQAARIRQFEEAYSQALQAEKMASIEQFAAGVAHEINNPIAFVKSNMGSMKRYVDDLLKLLSAYERIEDRLPASARAEVDRLKSELDLAYLREDVDYLLTESMDGLVRVTCIVEDLSDYSRANGTEWQRMDLERGLETALEVVRNKVRYKAEVVKNYSGIPEIDCVPSEINRVFSNLLLNAAQAIEGRGCITLRTGADEQIVWVEVADTGKGIAPEHLNRIFDPFFTTKAVGEGAGLGLFISHGIIRRHGGRIEVKIEQDKGSTFRVVLPYRANHGQTG